jgi:YD repeat-containing protein
MSRARTAARRLSSGVALLPLTLACAAGAATTAKAQTTPDAPAVISPLRVETDVNDVNLVTGKTVLKTPSISVPAAPNLKFDWVQNAAPYVSGTITTGDVSGDTPAQGSYSVHTGGGASESFKCPDMDCTSVTGTGSTFVPNIYRFRQGGSGALWQFNLKHVDSQGPTNRTVLYYASSVSYPNGETISYSYDTATLAGDPYLRTFYRPNRVTSSLGYYIAITYQSNDFSQNAWASVAQATLYAASDPSTPLARLTYSGNSITDINGRTFTCTACANALGNNLETSSGSLTLPTESTAAHQVGQSAQTSTLPIIGSVVMDGVTWTYSYSNPRLNNKASAWLYDSVTVTGPNGYHNVYAMTVSDQQNVITGTTDSLGRTSTFAFDTAFRAIALVAPEGNRVDIAYDEWGNIISKTTTPKPGSGLSAVTETAYVDATNCANSGSPVLCYRPVWTRDPLGRQTDYVYNSLGQVTSKSEPADQNGVRRMTYITYESSTGISRPSVVRVCGDITTCGTVDEVRTEYTYWGATLLPLTESRIDARQGVTLTTTYSYDGAGRVLSTDGPLPGTDDAAYYKYDLVGRKTWEIGPRLTNGYRTAKKFTYRDSDDKVIAIQTGSLTDVVNPVFLVTSERVDTAFDSRRNPVREAVSGSDSLVYALTERDFNDRGQLVCQAQRMNAANFGATTDGCTLTSAGSYGPDRIVHNVYDAAGQLNQVQKAYGTALQQNYATYEYTQNGKQKAVIDANNNRAELTWDGFDRQRRWIFPSPTTAGVANQADYEEYGYDAIGNRTTLRKRDGVTLTYAYDGMNRLTLKAVPASATGAAGYSVYYGYEVR